MLYRILKPLVGNATKNFFREIHRIGEPVEDGPLIITSNHPNVMLDGLLVVGTYKRDIWFIVKSTIFRGPHINWFLRWIHFAPVHRRKDLPDQMHENEGAFRDVSELLARGYAFLIFPEGDSIAQRLLLKIKTGAARIALQTEAENNFELGVKIQPIGITYSDFFRFNSSVTVCVDKPIRVKAYKTSYEKDPEQAVRELTDEIERRLKELVVEVEDREAKDLVRLVDKLYQSSVKGLDDRTRLKIVAEKAVEAKQKYPERVDNLMRRLLLYREFSESLKLRGNEDFETNESKLFIMLISPFILLGIITLFIPYKVSYYASKWLARRSSQYSSYALSVAFILFPLWELFLAVLIYWYTGDFTTAVLSILLFVGCGYLTGRYFNRFAIYIFTLIWPGRKTPVDVLRNLRDELIYEVEQLIERDSTIWAEEPHFEDSTKDY